jgi:hypothetical protein
MVIVLSETVMGFLRRHIFLMTTGSRARGQGLFI